MRTKLLPGKQFNIVINSKEILQSSGLCMLFFYLSILHINGQTFGNIAMGGGGFVSGIITCKTQQNLIYARTDVGGAYRWDETNKTWIPLNDWASSSEMGLMGVESLAIDPGNPNYLYMLLGTSYFNNGKTVIYRSTDKGNTYALTDVTSQFKAHGNGAGRNTGEKLVVDPNLGTTLFCGTRSNGLFKSTNSGASWSLVTSLNVTTTTNGNGISFVIFDPSTGTSGSATQTLIVGISRTGSTNLYRSEDGGNTFSAVSGAPTTLMPERASVANDRILYISYANTEGPGGSTSGQIWKYNFASSSLTNVTPSGITLPFCGISVDPNNSNRVLASTTNIYWTQGTSSGDQFFLSNNGGSSWVNKTANGYKVDPNGIAWAAIGLNIHWAGSIEFDPFNTKRVFVNSGNGLFTTNNIDSTTNVWKFNVKGLEETVAMDLISIPNGPLISAVGDIIGFRNQSALVYGPLLTSNLSSLSWGSYNSVAYAALKSGTVFLTGNSGGAAMFNSVDTGKTWIKCATKMGVSGKLAVSADGNIILHCPIGSSITYRSANKGATWSNVNGLSLSDAEPVADPINSSVFYAYNWSSGVMMVSNNGGVSFYPSGSPGSYGSTRIRTVPGYEGHIWVALKGGGLTRSINSGVTFSKIATVSTCDAVGIGMTAPGAPYPTLFIWGVVAGIEGFYFSTDEGTTWNRMNDAAHEWGSPVGNFVTGDMNVLGQAYMSNPGRGIVFAKPDYMLFASSLSVGVGNTIQVKDTVLNNTSVSWTWTSSAPTIASVNAAGVVTGVALGTATITATTSGGKSVKIGVRVATPVTDISITPDTIHIEVGTTQQYTATVNPSDATYKTVSWSSLNKSIATVSSSGLVAGIKVGTTVISAVVDGKKANKYLSVGTPVTGISFTSTSASINILDTMRLIANILPSNATDKTVSWNSSNTAVASVNSSGLVTGKINGSATITATTTDGGFQATFAFTVTGINVSSISVSPPSDTIKIKEKVQINPVILPSNATVKTITWTSNLNVVATVDSAGLVTGKSKGTTTITAKSLDGSKTATCVIVVSGDTATSVNTSAASREVSDNISLYPNPLNGKQLTVELGNFEGKTDIRIMDINGQTFLEHSTVNKPRIQMDIDLNPGIYFVQIANKQKTILKKLIIEK